ncbi:MAG TPA: metallophosphoesterase [Thermoanaerobaculia bacterium]|nr:metallophosphoesterase [Thermoanaerobaculia bacterium]
MTSIVPYVIAALVFISFLTLNVIVYRALIRIHPKRVLFVRLAFTIGNLFWLALPFLFTMRGSMAMILLRSFLGPPWFSWLIFLILYSAFLMVVALLWLPARRRVPFAQFASKPSRVILVLGALIVVAGFYSALVPLRVANVRIPLSDLPPAFDGYRIALISDLHVGLFTRSSRLHEISRALNSLDPSVVLVAGDFVDDASYFVPKFVEGMAGVTDGVPILAVLGNHEIYGDPEKVVERMRAQSRVSLLLNDAWTIRRRDQALSIAGISDHAAEGRNAPDWLRPDLGKALQAVPAGSFPLLLSHQPKAFEDAIASRIGLTMTGHSHGGQFGIRRWNWSLAGVFIPYHMGLYESGGSNLFVTTGAGYWVVPFRLGMSPEVVLIELLRK